MGVDVERRFQIAVPKQFLSRLDRFALLVQQGRLGVPEGVPAELRQARFLAGRVVICCRQARLDRLLARPPAYDYRPVIAIPIDGAVGSSSLGYRNEKSGGSVDRVGGGFVGGGSRELESSPIACNSGASRERGSGRSTLLQHQG